jgi:hypothetical protein
MFLQTSVDTQRTTRRYIPGDGTLHNQHCENLKSYMCLKYLYGCAITKELRKFLSFN